MPVKIYLKKKLCNRQLWLDELEINHTPELQVAVWLLFTSILTL